MGFLDSLLAETKTEPLRDKAGGVHFMMQSLVVPPMVVYAQAYKLSVGDGVSKAIRQGVSFAQVQADPGFNTLMSSMGGIVSSLMKDYGADAKLKPGQTIESSADWMLNQIAGMSFNSSSGPVKGLEIYASIISTPGGRDWFRALIRDIYNTLGLGRP